MEQLNEAEKNFLEEEQAFNLDTPVKNNNILNHFPIFSQPSLDQSKNNPRPTSHFIRQQQNYTFPEGQIFEFDQHLQNKQNNRIKELIKENQRLKTQLQNYQIAFEQEVDTMNKEFQNLKQELQTNKHLIALQRQQQNQLKEQLNNYKSEISAIRTQFSTKQCQYKQTNKELMQTIQKKDKLYKELNEEFEKLFQKYSQSEQQMKKDRQCIEDMKKMQLFYFKGQELQKNDNDQMQEHIVQMKKMYQEKINNLIKQLEAAKKQIEMKHIESNKISNQLKQLAAVKKQLEIQILQTNNQNNQLTKQLVVAKNQLEMKTLEKVDKQTNKQLSVKKQFQMKVFQTSKKSNQLKQFYQQKIKRLQQLERQNQMLKEEQRRRNEHSQEIEEKIDIVNSLSTELGLVNPDKNEIMDKIYEFLLENQNLMEENRQLHHQIKNISSDNEQKEKLLEELQRKLRQQVKQSFQQWDQEFKNRKIETLNKRLQKKQEELDGLQQEIKKKIKQNRQLEQEILRFKTNEIEEKRKFTQQLTKLKLQLDKKKNQWSNTKKKMEIQLNQYIQKDKNSMIVQKLKSNYTKELYDKEKELKKKEKQISRINGELLKIESEKDRDFAQKQKVSQQLHLKTKELSKKDNQLKKLCSIYNQEIAKLKQTHKKHNHSKQKQRIFLAEQNKQLKIQNQFLQKQQQQFNDQIKNYEEMIMELSNKQKIFIDQLAQKQKSIQHLQDKLTSDSSNNIQVLDQHVKELFQQLKQKQDKIEALQKQNYNKELTLEFFQKRLGKVEKQKLELEAESKIHRSIYLPSQNEVKQTIKTYEQKIKQFSRVIQKQHSRINQLESLPSKDKVSHETLKQNCQSKIQILHLKNKIKQLSSALSKANNSKNRGLTPQALSKQQTYQFLISLLRRVNKSVQMSKIFYNSTEFLQIVSNIDRRGNSSRRSYI